MFKRCFIKLSRATYAQVQLCLDTHSEFMEEFYRINNQNDSSAISGQEYFTKLAQPSPMRRDQGQMYLDLQ